MFCFVAPFMYSSELSLSSKQVVLNRFVPFFFPSSYFFFFRAMN